MPIYEYECPDCHHHFDVIQKFSDIAVSECPECHHSSVIRLISAPAFQLKGTGWYETDFKNKGKAPVSESNSASSVSPKSDSKVATSTTKSTASEPTKSKGDSA